MRFYQVSFDRYDDFAGQQRYEFAWDSQAVSRRHRVNQDDSKRRYRDTRDPCATIER
jgi:hypothetical protein